MQLRCFDYLSPHGRRRVDAAELGFLHVPTVVELQVVQVRSWVRHLLMVSCCVRATLSGNGEQTVLVLRGYTWRCEAIIIRYTGLYGELD